MQKWFKFSLDPQTRGFHRIAIEDDFKHYSTGGDYHSDQFYVSQDAFLQHYLPRNGGRHDIYDSFLKRHLQKNQMILSIASGRAANEACLSREGYSVTCSDVDVPPVYGDTHKLFPSLRYEALNILERPASKKFDAIFCLSLIYLFSDQELLKVMTHINESLNDEGCFVLDSSTSPDNLLTFFIHRILLPLEVSVRGLLEFSKCGKFPGLVMRHHGYLRSDREILKAATLTGFELVEKEDSCFLAEFRRSALLSKILRPGSRIEKIFESWGRFIPYVRMFYFKKRKPVT